MENTINELRKFAEWCEFKTTAALRQGIELAIENYIKEKQCDIHVVVDSENTESLKYFDEEDVYEVSQQRELLKTFCHYIGVDQMVDSDDMMVDIEEHIRVFNCG